MGDAIPDVTGDAGLTGDELTSPEGRMALVGGGIVSDCIARSGEVGGGIVSDCIARSGEIGVGGAGAAARSVTEASWVETAARSVTEASLDGTAVRSTAGVCRVGWCGLPPLVTATVDGVATVRLPVGSRTPGALAAEPVVGDEHWPRCPASCTSKVSSWVRNSTSVR